MRDTTRQQLTGKVISNKMDKTVVVEIETLKKHPRYKKYVRSRKRYKAHDEKNECGLGDKVLLMETRPISKEKFLRVVNILEKGSVPTGEVVEPEELFRRRRQRREESRAAAEAERLAEEAAAAAEAGEAEVEVAVEAKQPEAAEEPAVEAAEEAKPETVEEPAAE